MAACKQWRNVQYVVLFYSVIGAIYYAGYYGGIATRLKVPPVNPSSFVLPQDVMVDSGAVLSFFGLRNRTDVDLLFQGNVTASLLGNQRGIHVEEHAFETNARFDEHNRRVARKRAWGAEHLSNCTVDDLFTDPQYYGYCHGMKFVSLEHLIRYKQRRGEPNKDDKDVSSLERFITGSINGTA